MKATTTLLILWMMTVPLVAMAGKKERTIEYPRMGWRTDSGVELNRIMLSDTATVLCFDLFAEEGCTFAISSDACVRVDGKSLPVKGTSGIELGKTTAVADGGRVSFSLMFPPIDSRTELLSFSNGEGWSMFDIDLTGKRYCDGHPEGLPEDVKRLRPSSKAALPEPFLTTGTTTLRVHVLAYERYRETLPRMMWLYINEFFPAEQRSLTAQISDEGVAEFTFPQYATVECFPVMMRSTGSMTPGGVWLKPGETADVYVNLSRIVRYDTQYNYERPMPCRQHRGYFRGHYAELNILLQEDYDGLDYKLKLHNSGFADYHMTADAYAAHVQKRYEEGKRNIEKYKGLPRMIRQLYLLDLQGETMEALFDAGDQLTLNYRSVHNQWDRSEALDYTPPTLGREHYALLRSLPLNSPYFLYNGHTYELSKTFGSDPAAVGLLTADTCGLLPDMAKACTLPTQIRVGKPLSAEQERMLASLSYPFFGEVCHSLQKEIYAKLKEAAAKQGYTMCDVPDVEADSVFAAIAARYRGKAVLVDFWATWCGPCKGAISEMEPLKRQEAGNDGVQFVYLTSVSSPESTWRIMAADIHGHHYRLSREQWNAVSDRFGIHYIPSYVLIRPDGTCIRIEDAYKSPAALLKMLHEAQAKGQ